jgi:glycogen synthase
MFRRILSQLFLFLFVVNAQIAYAATHTLLPSYGELSKALIQGDEVRAIITLKHCTDHAGQAVKNELTGGLNFTQFNKYLLSDEKRFTIATSTNMLVKTPNYGHVYNYVRLRIFEDNSAELLSEFIDPKNFNILKTASYHCHLKNSDEPAGVSLYDLA